MTAKDPYIEKLAYETYNENAHAKILQNVEARIAPGN